MCIWFVKIGSGVIVYNAKWGFTALNSTEYGQVGVINQLKAYKLCVDDTRSGLQSQQQHPV